VTRPGHRSDDVAPGHGPADPRGYSITHGPDGYLLTRRADDRTSGPFATREDAVDAVLAEAGEG